MRNTRMTGQYQSETYDDGTRRCVFCGLVKDLETGYHKNGTHLDGSPAYRLDCKVCYNVRRSENKTKKRHSDFIGGQRRRGEEAPELSHQEWKEIMIYFGGECAYCGATPRPNKKLTRDHLQPVSKGGRTEPSNIVPACAPCNSSKNDDDFKDWYMKQAFFSQERLNRIFKWRTIMRQVGNG